MGQPGCLGVGTATVREWGGFGPYVCAVVRAVLLTQSLHSGYYSNAYDLQPGRSSYLTASHR